MHENMHHFFRCNAGCFSSSALVFFSPFFFFMLIHFPFYSSKKKKKTKSMHFELEISIDAMHLRKYKDAIAKYLEEKWSFKAIMHSIHLLDVQHKYSTYKLSKVNIIFVFLYFDLSVQ